MAGRLAVLNPICILIHLTNLSRDHVSARYNWYLGGAGGQCGQQIKIVAYIRKRWLSLITSAVKRKMKMKMKLKFTNEYKLRIISSNAILGISHILHLHNSSLCHFPYIQSIIVEGMNFARILKLKINFMTYTIKSYAIHTHAG